MDNQWAEDIVTGFEFQGYLDRDEVVDALVAERKRSLDLISHLVYLIKTNMGPTFLANMSKDSHDFSCKSNTANKEEDKSLRDN